MPRPFTPSPWRLTKAIEAAEASFDASFAVAHTMDVRGTLGELRRVVTPAYADELFEANAGVSARARRAAEVLHGYGPRGALTTTQAGAKVRAVNDDLWPGFHALRVAGLAITFKDPINDATTRTSLTEAGREAMARYAGAVAIIERCAAAEVA